MKTRTYIPVFMLILAMLACNMPSGESTPPAETESTATTIPPTQAQSTETPSATPLPTNTSLPTLTPTPLVPIAWPSDKSVNCRFGPGVDWLVVGALLVGQTATIQGRNADSSWWYVVTPNDPGKPCWVAASVTNYAGNLAGLSVVSPPEASVIGVLLKVDPDEMSVAGCIGPLQPVSLEGQIEVNGPAQVKWYFETQQSGAMPTQTTNFNNAESKDVSADYTPVLTAGTYWVRLIVIEPNNKTTEAKYKIECP
jgi:hypothetical protein